MSFINQYYNQRIDPFTLEKRPIRIMSEMPTCPPSEDYLYAYPRIKAPTEVDELGRIVIELPEVPYLDDPRNKPFVLYHTEMLSSNTLTKVNTTPQSANTYMLANQNSSRPHCVWLSPDLAGKDIFFLYYGLGTVVNADNLNDFRCKNLTVKKEISTLSVDELTINKINNLQIKNNQFMTSAIPVGTTYERNSVGGSGWYAFSDFGKIPFEFHTVSLYSTHSEAVWEDIDLRRNYESKDKMIVLYNAVCESPIYPAALKIFTDVRIIDKSHVRISVQNNSTSGGDDFWFNFHILVIGIKDV